MVLVFVKPLNPKKGKRLFPAFNNSLIFETMAQAIKYLHDKTENGDMVLLSPACASIDQFKNFEQRGEEFTKLAKLLG